MNDRDMAKIEDLDCLQGWLNSAVLFAKKPNYESAAFFLRKAIDVIDDPEYIGNLKALATTLTEKSKEEK
jgi:hypothetical protein